ncbi:MAG: Holliday junction resolvase RuvX [Alphaproteobacteria bacterium]|nr:Holliday junction resolvase RuvX [Alphaproteobacteria bacterium]
MPLLALADFMDVLPARGCLLGVDVGTKTLGLALSDPAWRLATPHTTLARKKFTTDVQAMAHIIIQRKVAGVIMGLPRGLDGKQTPMTQSVMQFAENFLTHAAIVPLNLPLAMWDERLSTLAMERALIALDTTRARRKDLIDQMAAQYILQGALDYLGNRGLE